MGYSVYGDYQGLGLTFTNIDLKEWITTSDVTGLAHPNQPGNIGSITMVSSTLSETTIIFTYTAAQSNGDFKFLRIASRPITTIMHKQGQPTWTTHTLGVHDIMNYYVTQGDTLDFSSCMEVEADAP